MIELKVPSVGESISEVQIGEWMVGVGEGAGADEVLVFIETDKVTVELPAPAAGTLSKVLKKQGEAATVGEVIGYFDETQVPDSVPAGAAPSAAASSDAPAAAPSAAASGPARVMPAAARVLGEAGVSPEGLSGSGPGGRILKEDAVAHLRSRSASGGPAPSVGGSREEELVPMTPIRQRIAERLVQAQSQAALLTTFNEVDVSAVKELRRNLQEQFQKKHGVKLGFMSFFVKAVIEALKETPRINACIEGDAVRYRNYYDIGIAVGGGKGLVVPVLRNAERLSFAEVETAIGDFAVRARDNKLGLDELSGGTFTISNGGVYGSLLSTPIVNPPQSGILGLHAIQDRPVAVDGQVVIRPMMYLALTYDHRIVDGREAVTFLKRIKECVEDPRRILLEV